MTGIEIAILSIAAAGVATQAYAQYQEGKSAAQQARAQAAWHDYNAKITKRDAEAERQATAFDVQQQKRIAEQVAARRRVIIGGAGVTPEGSPLLVAEDEAAQYALEEANIRMTGARRAEAYRTQSILDISKAGAARTAAAGYKKAGIYRAGASILGGAADVGYMGYKMGPFDPKSSKYIFGKK